MFTKCPVSIILKSYDWAIEQRDNGNCVISGFHSKIEKDVFFYLLKGTQPIILILARGLKKRYPPEIKTAFANNRLLIISPFVESVSHNIAKNAQIRNQLMVDLADEVLIVYAAKKGNLLKLVEDYKENGKKFISFGADENE